MPLRDARIEGKIELALAALLPSITEEHAEFLFLVAFVGLHPWP
jgi:hypothetical protein